MQSFVRFLHIVVLGLLTACGGGGGGGGGSGNSISVSPGSVSLVAGSGSNDVTSTTVQVAFHGAGVVVGIPPGGSLPSWLVVTPGTASASSVPITIAANAGGMAPGRYPVTLRFVTGNADQSGLVWQDVDVVLVVAPRATPGTLQLDGVAAGPKVGANVALVVAGNWTARGSDPWLTVDKVSGSTSTTLVVSADPAALAAGDYSGSVTVEDTATHVATIVPVSFGVDPQRLVVRERGVAFSLFGSQSRLARTITVSANGKAGTHWSATSDQAWLKLGVAEGTTDGALTLTADATGLADGMHYARVTIAPKNEPAVANSVVVRAGLYVSRGSVYVANVSGDARVPSPYPPVQAFDFVPDPIRPYFYHSQGDATIDIHNTYTGAIVGSVSIPNTNLGAMATSLDGSRMFVVDVTGAKIYPVDLDTLAVGAPIVNVRFVNGLSGIAWTEVNGQQVIVTGGRQVFDASNGSLLADAWNASDFITQAQRIAARRDGRAVFFQDGSYANHDLSRYSLSWRGGVLRFVRTHKINETGDAGGVALDVGDTRLYTAARSVVVGVQPTAGYGYDAATLAPAGSLLTNSNWSSGVVASPGGAVYVSDWSGSLALTFNSSFVQTASYQFGEHTDRLNLSGDGHRLGMYVQSSMKRVLHFTDVP
jgi:hypothetical protein